MNELEMDELVIREVVDKSKAKIKKVSNLKIGSMFKQRQSQQLDYFSPKTKYSSTFCNTLRTEDSQYQSLDKNIDSLIEAVALKVNEKEALVKEGNILRDQVFESKREEDALNKESGKIEGFVKKYEKQQRDLFYQNACLRDEIMKIKNSINHYKTQVQLDIDFKEKEREEKKLKLDQGFKEFQVELTSVLDHLRTEQDYIAHMTHQFSIMEQQRYNLTKDVNHAVKLENERMKLLRTKSKVLESVISEERLTKKFGDSASHSPIGKRVQQLVRGRKWQ